MKAAELRNRMRVVRPEVTSDQYVCGQVVNEYKELQLQGKRVFDLGGNIGAFTMFAHLRGASQIWAYEPDPENFKVMEANVGDLDSVYLMQGAVIRGEEAHVPFYLTNGQARDGFSTVAFAGRTEIAVAAYQFAYEMEQFHPQVIKMDIEGGEYELLKDPLPEYVKEIVVEIHFSKRRFREQFPQLISQFADWEVIKGPKQTTTNFHTLGHWRRG